MDYSTQAGSAAARADPYDVVLHHIHGGDSFDHIFLDLKRAGYQTGYSNGFGQVKRARVHVVFMGYDCNHMSEWNIKKILRSGETIIPVFLCDEPTWPPEFPPGFCVHDAVYYDAPAQSTYCLASRRAQPLPILSESALMMAKFRVAWFRTRWSVSLRLLGKITAHHLARYNDDGDKLKLEILIKVSSSVYVPLLEETKQLRSDNQIFNKRLSMLEENLQFAKRMAI